MKEKWKQFRLWAILFSVAMILLGVLTLIWPGIKLYPIKWTKWVFRNP